MEPSSPIRIVIVEDEGFLRDLIRGALTGIEGLEVIATYGDAATAAAKIPALAPDVALLDIDLGQGGNGVQLGLAMRRKLPHLGIVLLSNHRDPSYLMAVPPNEVVGWSYLHKKSMSDTTTLLRAIRGSAAGYVMLDPVIAAGLKGSKGGLNQLSERSLALLKLLAQGYSNAAIASQLSLAEKTVENQLNALYKQLDIDTSDSNSHSRVQATLTYLRALSV
ncbi:response regulator transcription factor [bacterium]|nr:response regulator transcription factor [bacterium]